MIARALQLTALLAAVSTPALAQPKRKPWKDKIKAKLLCGVVKDGKVATVVPTKDKRKLADPISCAIHLDQDSKAGETWTVHLFVEDGEPDGHPAHDGEISRTGKDAHDFEAVLVPGSDNNRQDYWSCQRFSIRAMISNDAGVLWMKDLMVDQKCPPPPPPPPPNAASLHWTENARSSLPDDAARDVALAWAAAYERNDDEWFRANFPKAGMAIPGSSKLTWKGMQNAGAQPQDIFKITPGGACKDEEKREGCAWGDWDTLEKSKTEFWLYNASQSGYGSFPAAQFKKVGKAWTWVGMRVYDTGEP